MDLDSAFKILEIEKTTDLSEVRRAYRDLAEIWHPDKYAHKPRLAEKAAAKMKEINCAYDVIQDYFKNNESSFNESPSNETEEEELFDFVDCINCGAKNRVSKNISGQTLKCGKCGLNPNVKPEKSDHYGEYCGLKSCEGRILMNGLCSVCGRTLMEGVQAEEAFSSSRNTKGTPSSSNFFGGNHHPWRRFFARNLDTFGGLLLFVPLVYALGDLFPSKVQFFENPFVVGVILVVLWFPLEAALLSTAGTTPARFLFGVSVRTTSGRKLSFDQALTRSFQVLLQGQGLGIPFVAFFTQIFAHRRLVTTGTTLWDTATGCVVSHKKWGVVRAVLCTFVVLLAFGLTRIMNNWQPQQSKTLGVESVNTNQTGTLPELLKDSTQNNQQRGYSDEELAELMMAEARAFYKKGQEYAAAKQYAKEIDAYREAILINPNYFEAWSDLSAAYIDINQNAKAIEASQGAIRINPSNAYAWYNLGTAYNNSGQTEKAMEVYSRLMTLDPKLADLFFNKFFSPQSKK